MDKHDMDDRLDLIRPLQDSAEPQRTEPTEWTVEVSSHAPYTVHIGHGLTRNVASCAGALGARRAAIVAQPPLRVHATRLSSVLRENDIEPVILPIPDAEAAKTFDTLGRLWDELGKREFSRQDIVIGLGGGAATDLAGFTAATWMRGIRVIQVPTTLLGMVDAAVGGKTGINTPAGKNLVGAFHEPSAVFVDLDYLQALPQRELVAGSAEVIKTGFISDPVIVERFCSDPRASLNLEGFLPELIARAIRVKAEVVGSDLKESGLRETLNYGHTFGHAIEKVERYRWRHGNAVAVGMMYVAQLAYARGITDSCTLALHREILSNAGLPTSYRNPAVSFDDLWEAMRRDKKVRDGQVRFVAVSRPGTTCRIEDATEEELCAAYRAVSGVA